MNILFVAVFNPNSTNVSQSRGFRNIGHGVYEYDFRERRNQLGGDLQRDQDLIKCVEQLKPEVVVFSKADGINPSVIDECNKHSKTILWYMDALHNFNNNIIEKVKKVNSFVCGIPGVNLEAVKYNSNTFFVDQCYDEEFNFPITDITKDIDISFIGNVGPGIHGNRVPYINYIKEHFPTFRHFNNVFGLEHNNLINRTKINVNFTPTDATGTSVRFHKILASKGFIMSLPWTGMKDMFTPDKDFVVFNTPEEFKEKATYYLSHPEEMDKIREQGYQTIQNSHPNQWAKNLINTIA